MESDSTYKYVIENYDFLVKYLFNEGDVDNGRDFCERFPNERN